MSHPLLQKNQNISQTLLYNRENTCKIFLTAFWDGDNIGNY